jgi:hypothetical protein
MALAGAKASRRWEWGRSLIAIASSIPQKRSLLLRAYFGTFMGMLELRRGELCSLFGRHARHHQQRRFPLPPGRIDRGHQIGVDLLRGRRALKPAGFVLAREVGPLS